MYFSGESPDEEDNAFVRWAHRVRRLSSMTALRASTGRADVLLERKLRFGYAKLKTRGQLRNRTRYASATPVAASSDPVVRSNPLPPITIGEKRPRAQGDPGNDAQKHLRRMGSPAEGISHITMSSPTPGTLASSPDTGIDPYDDVISGVSPHGTGGSLAHGEASVVIGYRGGSMRRYFSS